MAKSLIATTSQIQLDQFEFGFPPSDLEASEVSVTEVNGAPPAAQPEWFEGTISEGTGGTTLVTVYVRPFDAKSSRADDFVFYVDLVRKSGESHTYTITVNLRDATLPDLRTNLIDVPLYARFMPPMQAHDSNLATRQEAVAPRAATTPASVDRLPRGSTYHLVVPKDANELPERLALWNPLFRPTPLAIDSGVSAVFRSRIIRDNFEGPEGTALSDHDPDGVISWESSPALVLSGDGRLHIDAEASGDSHNAYLNTEITGGVIRAIATCVSGPDRLTKFFFRSSGPDNQYVLVTGGGSTEFTLSKIEGGQATEIGTIAHPAAVGDTLTVEIDLSGADVEIYVNGTRGLSFTDPFNQDATRVGLGLAASMPGSWKDTHDFEKFVFDEGGL